MASRPSTWGCCGTPPRRIIGSTIEYFVGSSGAWSTRTIEPEAVFSSLGNWYVVAWDLGADDERLFRADRIRAAVATPATVRAARSRRARVARSTHRPATTCRSGSGSAPARDGSPSTTRRSTPSSATTARSRSRCPSREPGMDRRSCSCASGPDAEIARPGRAAGMSSRALWPNGRGSATGAECLGSRYPGLDPILARTLKPRSSGTDSSREMTTIRTTCPRCGEVDMGPEAILLSVRQNGREGSYRFTCPSCEDDVEKRADRKIVALLVSAGVDIEQAESDAGGSPGALRRARRRSAAGRSRPGRRSRSTT